jgi:hypothetical protein
MRELTRRRQEIGENQGTREMAQTRLNPGKTYPRLDRTEHHKVTKNNRPQKTVPKSQR